jgi:uncharacterized membrane protein
MLIKSRHIFIAVAVLTLLLILIVSVFPGNVLRIVLGLPLVLFFPGYTVMSAAFPRQSIISRPDKIVLSFGVSIAVTALLGLAISYTPWHIGLYSILISLSAFVLIFTAVAWFRQKSVPDHERPAITLRFKMASLAGFSRTEKALTAVLVVVIIATIGILAFVVSAPRSGDKFTEFYILDNNGKTVDYPSQLRLGEYGEVVAGVVNHEHKTVSYTLEVKVDGISDGSLQQLTLGSEEKWENTLRFTPARAGEGQKVDFLLFLAGQSKSCQDLHLWVSVNP